MIHVSGINICDVNENFRFLLIHTDFTIIFIARKNAHLGAENGLKCFLTFFSIKNKVCLPPLLE